MKKALEAIGARKYNEKCISHFSLGCHTSSSSRVSPIVISRLVGLPTTVETPYEPSCYRRFLMPRDKRYLNTVTL